MNSQPYHKRFYFYPLIFVGLGLLASIIIPLVGHVSAPASAKLIDLVHLKGIAQANLIYAQDHQERFPEATDVWDHAQLLAEGAGLDDARSWQSRADPAHKSTYRDPTPILAPAIDNQPRELTPEFRALKLSVAVPLGKLTASMPATTPIAWTRGLQPDGTWAKHSPYSNDGGHIAFIGGNVAYYRNLTDAGGQLTRFDGQGKTSNILEALPPGTRISEYIPTAEEKTAWTRAEKHKAYLKWLKAHSPLLALTGLWLPFVITSIYRLIKHRPGAFILFLWPLIISLISALLFFVY